MGGSTLHIDGRALDGGAAGLWRVVLEHTESERVTAHLLTELAAARRAGPVDYAVIVPAAGDPADEGGWALQVVHADPTPDPPARAARG